MLTYPELELAHDDADAECLLSQNAAKMLDINSFNLYTKEFTSGEFLRQANCEIYHSKYSLVIRIHG